MTRRAAQTRTVSALVVQAFVTRVAAREFMAEPPVEAQSTRSQLLLFQCESRRVRDEIEVDHACWETITERRLRTAPPDNSAPHASHSGRTTRVLLLGQPSDTASIHSLRGHEEHSAQRCSAGRSLVASPAASALPWGRQALRSAPANREESRRFPIPNC